MTGDFYKCQLCNDVIAKNTNCGCQQNQQINRSMQVTDRQIIIASFILTALFALTIQFLWQTNSLH